LHLNIKKLEAQSLFIACNKWMCASAFERC